MFKAIFIFGFLLLSLILITLIFFKFRNIKLTDIGVKIFFVITIIGFICLMTGYYFLSKQLNKQITQDKIELIEKIDSINDGINQIIKLDKNHYQDAIDYSIMEINEFGDTVYRECSIDTIL